MTAYRDPTDELIAIQDRIADVIHRGPNDRHNYDPDQRLKRIADDLARLAGGEYRPAYNGWTNRETWSASLWIYNDEAAYTAAREVVRDAMDGSDWDSRQMVDPAEDRHYQIRTAGDALRDWWDETCREQAGALADDYTGPMSDAWTYAVAVTDWYAVADALAEDMPAAGSGYLPR